MPTQTLAEAAKLVNNEIVQGVAEDIITTNPIYNVMPWTPYEGQALLVNRENALGDAQHLAVGGTITAKNAATYTQVPFTATTTIGDAEMNGLVQAQSSSAGVDQLAIEISSKAKSVGRLLQAGMVTGTGIAPQLNSLHSLVDSGQFAGGASAGRAISFQLLDALLDLVKAKDGEVDWIMMPARTLQSYKALVRSLGGVTETMAFTMPNGTTRNVSLYEGTPIFQNDYLSVAETANGAALTGGALTSVWAGVWDDGTQRVGASWIYPASTPAGIAVQQVGVAEARDEEIVRVKSYSNFAVFNRKGIARLASINN
jgi:hypothetical protein